MLFASKGYALCDARAQYSSLSSERRIFELCDLTLCYQREMADRVSTESSMPATVVVPDEGDVAEPEVVWGIQCMVYCWVQKTLSVFLWILCRGSR